MARQLCLAAYDIANPRRLAWARERVRGYSTGGQKSVFECLLEPSERALMLDDFAGLIEPKEDSFLLLTLDPRAFQLCLGLATPPRLGPFFYQG